jgi:glycosyltransferase involved in cell wall biosynthesis
MAGGPSLNERPVLGLPQRACCKMGRMRFRNDAQREVTAAYTKAFLRSDASAVLAEYGTTGVLVVPACRLLGIPLIVHFHGYDASVQSVLDEHRESYPIMFKQAAAIIAVSRAMERKLISLGAAREKVHYNPYGIDCTRFYGAIPAQAPATFLAVGRFVEKKAPHLTITAFRRVHDAYPAARLRMIGEGPLLERCKHLANELGLNGAITFLGARSHEVVQEEMRQVRCFVQHSVEASTGDSEGTPVGILEACASGLPVVSTRHAGIPDVVREGETGFLVDEHDVDAMAERMHRLANNAELAGEMGRAARAHVRSNFSREQSLGRLGAIIESCINQASASK